MREFWPITAGLVLNAVVSRDGRYCGVSGFTSAGFFVASVEYRLWKTEGDILIRFCMADAKVTLRFLFNNAQPYSLDAKRIITFGDSAGGQIAQMPLLSQPDSISGKPTLAAWPKRLVAGVTWFGLCDFEKIIPFNPKGRTVFETASVLASLRRR
jgi:acetyl esterase/lipase